jgi:tetratricopeptide (TPR) repeat protein
MVGRYAEGASAIEESIALAEEIGDDTALPVSLNNIGHGHLVLGELEQSRIYRERALRAAERVGQQAWIGAATATLGQTQYYLGDWEQARRLAEEALSILQSLGPTWYVAYPLLYLGTLDVAEGRWESAARRLQEATEVASRSRDLQALWWAAVPQTELDLANGRVREAIDRLEHLRDMPDRVGRDSVFTLPYLALAYAEAGEIDTAETVVFEAVDRSTEMQARLYLVDALRVQGILRARRSNWLAAQHVLDEALTLARSMRYPYAEARILYELGLVARGQGDVPEARHRLQAALVIVKRLGARPCMERTREALQTVRRLPSGVS